MKKYINYLLAITIAVFVLSSCNGGDDPIPNLPNETTGVYFVDYGGSKVGSTIITKYDYKKDSVINNFYEAQNGVELTSNVQYGCEYNNKIYLMGNAADQVIVLDSAFVQTIPGVTEGIIAPRYCIDYNDYLYISCWGEAPDWNLMANSYIAKFNTKTNKVESTIALPGGPEGLAIANGNLYVALNFKNSVGVIKLSDNSISYIATPAVSSYFVKDKSENLYVSLVNSYSNPSTETGLGYIKTSSNTLDKVYKLDGISTNYSSIISPNKNCTGIYVLATVYDENWNTVAAVYNFDVEKGEYSPFIENLSGTLGISFNTANDNLYVFGGESYTEPGSVVVYKTDGTKVCEFDTGISPYWAFYLNYNE
ncbi:MAG TPA: hypothetical protein VJY41_14460 [Prolixibacteraceae bacterium]|nr:hypothetical protein [Prolixibacteraceae bacterium]